MNYLIVKDNIITNVIVAEKNYAEKMGFLPYYEGATVGSAYNPLSAEPIIKALKAENIQLQTQIVNL